MGFVILNEGVREDSEAKMLYVLTPEQCTFSLLTVGVGIPAIFHAAAVSGKDNRLQVTADVSLVQRLTIEKIVRRVGRDGELEGDPCTRKTGLNSCKPERAALQLRERGCVRKTWV